MEPKPHFNLQPDAKRRRPLDSIEDEVEPGDVDEAEDKAWRDWVNDDSGLIKPPLSPVDQPEMGIHAPTPEMDDRDRELQEEWEKRREQEQNENDPNSLPRGVWEMKK